MAHDILRRCTFRPYRSGYGPTFHLTTWDTHTPQGRGGTLIGYRLTMRDASGLRGYHRLALLRSLTHDETRQQWAFIMAGVL